METPSLRIVVTSIKGPRTNINAIFAEILQIVTVIVSSFDETSRLVTATTRNLSNEQM
jgi:hypothetical protein